MSTLSNENTYKNVWAEFEFLSLSPYLIRPYTQARMTDVRHVGCASCLSLPTDIEAKRRMCMQQHCRGMESLLYAPYLTARLARVDAFLKPRRTVIGLLGRQEYQVATSTPDDPRFINKISAGPLVDEGDKYMIGSFFLVASTREEAQAFVDNDPFKKARETTTAMFLFFLFWEQGEWKYWWNPS